MGTVVVVVAWLALIAGGFAVGEVRRALADADVRGLPW
jgi:hypothetical protein